MATSAPRIWLTRSDAGNRDWAPKVRAAGYAVGSMATLSFEVLPGGRETLAKALQTAQWAVFTSERGVQAAFEWDLDWPASLRYACVGPKTAEALRRAGHEADCLASGGTGADLARALVQLPDWDRVALIGAETPLEEPHTSLCAAGKQVHPCPVYRTLQKVSALPAEALQKGDVVFVASPSAVAALEAQNALDPGLVWISIGPSTSAALRRAGLEPSAEATSRTIEGLLQALQIQRNHPG